MTETQPVTQTVKELEGLCLWTRRRVLEMAVAANSGHVSTAMSQTEILVALYFGGILRYDPQNPQWDGRDIFLLSKGQGGIGLYPILAKAGYFFESELDNFCGEGSHLGVHAEWNVPGIEMISGSLGHGLPVATGIAAAFKADGKDNLVYCLVGDGELHEGSNWEAMLAAAHLKLGNLVVIVDRNGQNTIGRTRDPMPSPKDGPGLGDLTLKFQAFGFNVLQVTNGNCVSEVLDALKIAKVGPRVRPLAIIVNTKKGYGLTTVQDQRDWHYRVPTGEVLEQCRIDLGGDNWRPPFTNPPVTQVKHGVAMRDRFFDALLPYFQRDDRYVLVTADNGFPGIDEYAKLKNQFFQVGIAEQEMVGMAAGLAMQGRRPFVYAIAPFVSTRVHEFAKLDAAAMNLPITFVGVGAGFAYDIMCVTHHNVEDIAIMRSLPNMTVYGPADGVTATAVAKIVAQKDDPTYVRLDRGGIPDLYAGFMCDEWQPHMVGTFADGLLQLRDGTGIGIIATGIMVHEAFKAAHLLGGAAVYDYFRLNPRHPNLHKLLDHDGITNVVTLEEHQLNGGLGSIVAETFADTGWHRPLLRLGVPNCFTFDLGGREVIWRKYGLDAASVARRIKEWAK